MLRNAMRTLGHRVDEDLLSCIALRLDKFSPDLDDAILKVIEARSAKDQIAAFTETALRYKSHNHLRELLDMSVFLAFEFGCVTWASVVRRVRRLALRPEVVAGAQAAIAIASSQKNYERSMFALVLAASGTSESLASLKGLISRALKQEDATLDWLARDAVPFLRERSTKDAIRLADRLCDTLCTRAKRSPARKFARRIGMVPPPEVLQFTWRLRTEDNSAYCVDVDSTRARWFTTWSSHKEWDYSDPSTIVLPVDVTVSIVRIKSDGVDRSRLDVWARSLLHGEASRFHITRLDRRRRGRQVVLNNIALEYTSKTSGTVAVPYVPDRATSIRRRQP